MSLFLKDAQSDDFTEVSEINVTPFIDVILVLLIIFMVAAPLSTVDVAVNLPVSNAQPQPRPEKPVFLTLTKDLKLWLGDREMSRQSVTSFIDEQTGQDHEQRIFVRADGSVAYQDLMGVMNLLRQAGYVKIALVGLEDLGQAPSPSPGPANP